MHYLAIDYGQKRIGLAGSDSGVLATPLEIISVTNPESRLDLVIEAIRKYNPEEIVIGVPVNENLSEGPMVQIIKQFSQKIREEFANKKITIINEFLTSIEARERAQRKPSEPVDDYAAAVILEQFFNQKDKLGS